MPYTDGRNFSFWWTGTSIFGLTVLISNFKTVQIASSYNIAQVVALTFSLLVYFITLLIAMT
jgi:hypothetical protein